MHVKRRSACGLCLQLNACTEDHLASHYRCCACMSTATVRHKAKRLSLAIDSLERTHRTLSTSTRYDSGAHIWVWPHERHLSFVGTQFRPQLCLEAKWHVQHNQFLDLVWIGHGPEHGVLTQHKALYSKVVAIHLWAHKMRMLPDVASVHQMDTAHGCSRWRA